MEEARLYNTRPDGSVDCNLCAFHCHISDGRHGICGVRENSAGTLYTNVYGKVIAENADPIEKKPLFHFLPKTTSYSVATVGCNFHCLHCQNWEISQMPKDQSKIIGKDRSPEDIVASASSLGCESIAYTYTEPTIFFEYAYDIGVLAKESGMKNIFVTNGYMTRACLDELDGVLDAANVDIKAFSDTFYKKVCGAKLAPVLKSIEHMRSLGIWVEITTLIIPTYNDTDDELKKIAKWIFQTDRSMPWHLSAFHPVYKLLDAPPTAIESIERARDIGLSEGLRYVYSGNVPGMAGENTYCYNCKKLLIERLGFMVKKNTIKAGLCPHCKAGIDGVF
jgi:pyruvate formate lyase activating enzyme